MLDAGGLAIHRANSFGLVTPACIAPAFGYPASLPDARIAAHS